MVMCSSQKFLKGEYVVLVTEKVSKSGLEEQNHIHSIS